jgi:hypothetical protein
MSSVSSANNFVQALQVLSSAVQKGRASNGDTASKETSESAPTKVAETSNSGYAPKGSPGSIVNILA